MADEDKKNPNTQVWTCTIDEQTRTGFHNLQLAIDTGRKHYLNLGAIYIDTAVVIGPGDSQFIEFNDQQQSGGLEDTDKDDDPARWYFFITPLRVGVELVEVVLIKQLKVQTHPPGTKFRIARLPSNL